MYLLRKWDLRCQMLQTLVFFLAAIQPTRCAVSQASCGVKVKDGVYSVAGAWTNQTHEYSNEACRQLSNRGRHQDCCRDEHRLFSSECFPPVASLEAFLQASRSRHLAFWGDSLTRQNYHSLLNSMAVQVGRPFLSRDTNMPCWQLKNESGVDRVRIRSVLPFPCLAGISPLHAVPTSWPPKPRMAECVGTWVAPHPGHSHINAYRKRIQGAQALGSTTSWPITHGVVDICPNAV